MLLLEGCEGSIALCVVSRNCYQLTNAAVTVIVSIKYIQRYRIFSDIFLSENMSLKLTCLELTV